MQAFFAIFYISFSEDAGTVLFPKQKEARELFPGFLDSCFFMHFIECGQDILIRLFCGKTYYYYADKTDRETQCQ